MLIGNYSVLNKSPGRAFSGSSVSDTRASFNKSGPARGIYTGSAIAAFNGVPSGYRPPFSFVIAQKSGGMASFNTISGTATTTSNLAGGLNAIAPLSGTGAITNADLALLLYAVASLSGTGSTTAAMTGNGNFAGSLSGSSSVSALLTILLDALANLSGSSSISAGLAGSLAGSADLTGSATVAANLAGVIEAVTALSGGGSVSAAATAIATANASLSGSGSLAAAIVALGNLVAPISGTGTVSAATATAYASLAAAISVSGDLLTSSNVGTAVWASLAAANDEAGSMGEKLNAAGAAGNPWNEVIESGYTAAEIMKLLASVMAGKSSGGGTATVKFRDLADSSDRITATVDGSGNRTAITLNP